VTTSAVAVRAGLPVGVAADVAPGHVAIGGLHGLVTGNRPEIY
jgi:hypothetical protein